MDEYDHQVYASFLIYPLDGPNCGVMPIMMIVS